MLTSVGIGMNVHSHLNLTFMPHLSATKQHDFCQDGRKNLFFLCALFNTASCVDRPSDSTVSEGAVFEPRTVAT
jgi:hypothetical protein